MVLGAHSSEYTSVKMSRGSLKLCGIMLTWPIQWWSDVLLRAISNIIIIVYYKYKKIVVLFNIIMSTVSWQAPNTWAKAGRVVSKGERIHNKTWAPQSFGSRPYRPTTRGEPPWSHALSVGWADRSMGMRYGYVAPNRHPPSVTNSIHQIQTRSPTLTEEPLVPIFPACFCSLLSLSLSHRWHRVRTSSAFG